MVQEEKKRTVQYRMDTKLRRKEQRSKQMKTNEEQTENNRTEQNRTERKRIGRTKRNTNKSYLKDQDIIMKETQNIE